MSSGNIAETVESLSKRRKILFGDDFFSENDDLESNEVYIKTRLKNDEAYKKLPKYLIEEQERENGDKGYAGSLLSKFNKEVEVANKKFDKDIIENGDELTVKIIQEIKEEESQDIISRKIGNKEEDLKELVLVPNSKEEHTATTVNTRSIGNTGLPFDDSTTRSNSGSLLFQETQKASNFVKPEWHAPWRLMRVMVGHTGWVRSLAMDPENKWFASGSADRTIKIWDLASSKLKLTLTGHIMAIRGIVVSPRHPYMFSCSEDKTVKCWDLEKNKIIRDYHGHLSSVYTIDIHPSLDIIATGGRDSTVRVWDIRTKLAIHTLTGHDLSVTNVKCQASEPQIVSSSMDSTVRTYDLVAGKTRQVLTHHKKSVRGLVLNEYENTFASASSDNIKQWKFPDCNFLQNFKPKHNAIINTLSLNPSGVMFSGADNGSMCFWDWKTGHKFQELATTKIPGSLESENGIFTSTFDKSGLRL
ncbi:hypothetical protein PACTADRAFT_50218, partial [Pachysolen tannophilus NRRL Y-2460]